MGKPVTHSRWLRGLQAGFDRYSQPKGSIARVSNMVYTRRGALKVCDGSSIFTVFNGSIQPAGNTFGPITEVFLFQPTGGTTAYFGIVKDINTHIGPPSGLNGVAGAAGALTGNYKYVITALDGAGGETTKSNEASVTLAAQKGSLTWTAVANAAGGYNVYRTVAGGATGTEHFVATVAGQATVAYTDNTPDGSLGPGTPPGADSTQVVEFYQFTVPSYTAAQIVATLPADALPILPSNPIGGGGGGSGSGGGSPQTPTGGVTGNTSPLPVIVQFVNKMMLALGNGITPYQSDGTSGGTTQITNTFSATYPSWSASTLFSLDDQIQVTVGGTAYVFTAIQGGETGSGMPTFSATLGKTVADGSIIWKNVGQVSGSPPPRGAAHAEVYAGSLWVANTGVTLSSDQLDGPSGLRQSDLNNPLSWNPLNAAQVSPDDGDQCTGIKAFTVAEAGIAPENFLMFFKNFSSYLIQGVFGATNFSITRLQTDLGCIAPRTIQFVPGFGIVRLSHLGFAVTDGINDKLQDPEAIRPYLFAESTESDIQQIDYSYLYFAKAAQTANPPMYVCAVPLLGSNTASNFGPFVTVAPFRSTNSGLAAGTYYVKIQVTTVAGFILVSNEYSVTVSGGTVHGLPYFPGIFVQVPTSASAASVSVYFGTSAGGENQFVTESPTGSFTVFYIDGASTINAGTPSLSSSGHLTRLFCYDLVLKAWTVVDLPFAISVLKQFRAPGILPLTVMAGFFDSALRRWQQGDVVWDSGATNAGNSTSVSWSFRDAEVFAEGGTVLLFHNQVIIRGDGGPTDVDVMATVNGQLQGTVEAALIALGSNQYEARARIMQRAENLNLTISGEGPATVESVNYEVTPKKVGAALVIS